MAVHWPEEDPRSQRRRRVSRRRGGPLTATSELFESTDAEPGGGPPSRFAYVLPTLVVVAILVIIGLLLAFLGPLPTIFPQLDCGACEIHN